MQGMLFLAEYANTSGDGKLNMMGIFDQINAYDYPARHPQLYVVARVISDIGEPSGMHQFGIVLVNEDSSEIGRIEGAFDLPVAARGARPEANIIANIRDLVFPKPGIYEFALLVDGHTIYHRPVAVNLLEQPGK